MPEVGSVIVFPTALYDVLSDFDPAFYEELLIVSGIELTRGDDTKIEISVSDQEKCPRCWNFRELGTNPHHPDVCARCAEALDAME